MKCLGRVLLILVAIAVVVAVVWYVLSRSEVTADLAAMRSDVQFWDASASEQESVPTGERRKVHAEDGVNVDTSGRARLSAEQCLWEVYRDTSLKVEQLPTESAQVCVVQLSHGTIYNRVQTQTLVKTDWAVVTALGTRFLVYLDPDRGLLWVLVEDGKVEVAASGEVVRLGPKEQTWVFRGKPPVTPRPALRSEADSINLPPVETMTNGELGDEDAFLPEAPVEAIEAPRLSLEQNVDKVLAGACTGAHTIKIAAYLTGSEEALANVAQAVVRYQWEDSPKLADDMVRADDRTFVVELGPFDYCCMETEAEYRVEMLDASGEVLVSRAGKFIITFCIE